MGSNFSEVSLYFICTTLMTLPAFYLELSLIHPTWSTVSLVHCALLPVPSTGLYIIMASINNYWIASWLLIFCTVTSMKGAKKRRCYELPFHCWHYFARVNFPAVWIIDFQRFVYWNRASRFLEKESVCYSFKFIYLRASRYEKSKT